MIPSLSDHSKSFIWTIRYLFNFKWPLTTVMETRVLMSKSIKFERTIALVKLGLAFFSSFRHSLFRLTGHYRVEKERMSGVDQLTLPADLPCGQLDTRRLASRGRHLGWPSCCQSWRSCSANYESNKILSQHFWVTFQKRWSPELTRIRTWTQHLCSVPDFLSEPFPPSLTWERCLSLATTRRWKTREKCIALNLINSSQKNYARIFWAWSTRASSIVGPITGAW